MLLDLTSLMESIEPFNRPIDTAPIYNSIQNMDVYGIESSQNSLEGLKKQLSDVGTIVENSIDEMNLMSSMQSSIEEMSTFKDIIENSIDKLFTFNQLDVDYFSSQVSSLVSNINFDFASETYDALSNRSDDLNNIEPNLNQILNKYQWFVLPQMPMSFVFELMDLSKTDKPRQKINQLFFDYFAYNNFENLKNLVNKWERGGKFRPGRLKIIRDCLNAIINSKNGKIPSTIIVPTLIAQIDGIQTKFLLKNDFRIHRTQFKDDHTGKKMSKNKAWKSCYEPGDLTSSMINDIILDVLFANALPGEPIKTPITFSRHKILHGEHLNYGTKFNTIRTFLILDFLHDIL